MQASVAIQDVTMTGTYRRTFERADVAGSLGHQERELQTQVLDAVSDDAFAYDGVTEIIGPNGTAIEVAPPKHGPRSARIGVAYGVVLLGFGVWIVVAAGDQRGAGAWVAALVCVALAVGMTLLWMRHPVRWVFDASGAVCESTLGERRVSWTDVQRLRLVTARRTRRLADHDHLRRLYFLDGDGRELLAVPYVHPTVRDVHQREDLAALVAIAGELRRRGWLPDLLDTLDDTDITPLMEAASAGDVARIEELVASGADLEAVDVEGMTALHWAARWGTEAAVVALVDAGADIDHRTWYGMSAYLEARHRDRPTARVLERLGADTELPPSGTVRFPAGLWLPVGATWLASLAVTVSVFLWVDPLPVWWDQLTALVFATAPGLLLARLVRPRLFWAGGVPREQTGSTLTLRRPWGRRMRLDLTAARGLARSPAVASRAGPVGGVRLLLVFDEDGPGTRLTDVRLRNSGFGDHLARIRRLGDRGVMLTVPPGGEVEVLSAIVPRLMDAGASVDDRSHTVLREAGAFARPPTRS